MARKSFRLTRLGLAAPLLVVAALAGLAHAEVEIVAEEGAQVSGEFPGVEWWWLFQPPVIGGRGHVAFGGQVVGPGIGAANDTMILAGIPGALHKVVQEGQPAPGTPAGVVFGSVPLTLQGSYNRHVVSDSGDVAVFARLHGPGVDGSNYLGVWLETDGVLGLVVRQGQPLPNGATLSTIRDFAFTDAGVVLWLEVAPGGTEIWYHRAGELVRVLGDQDSAPGFPGCSVWDLYRPVGSPSGEIAFEAVLYAEVSGATCPATMYVADGGAPVPLLWIGRPAPGFPGGSFFGSFSSGGLIRLPKINEEGELVLYAQVYVPGTQQYFPYSSSWLVRANGDLELLAFDGETLVSDPALSLYGLGSPVHNASGTSALGVTLDPGGGTAILAGEGRTSWNYDPLSQQIGPIGLTEVARTGEQALGLAAGTTYTSLDNPFLNNSGQLAFNGFVSQGGQCLWRGAPGALELTACENEFVDVVDPLGGPRVENVTLLSYLVSAPAPAGAGTGDGQSSPFSDTGQVVAGMDFSSGTYAITISPPDPVDTDGDGLADYFEGGNDIDGDGLANFEDLDADGDGVDDAVDNCPPVANPLQDAAPLGQQLIAVHRGRFEWPVALPFVAVRGEFTIADDVGAFVASDTRSGFGRVLPEPGVPASGSGTWYLARPDCPAATWASEGQGEPTGRDGALP